MERRCPRGGVAVSPDGVAGKGLRAKGRGGQRDRHIWNHFRSDPVLAVKGETGRLAGERWRELEGGGGLGGWGV